MIRSRRVWLVLLTTILLMAQVAPPRLVAAQIDRDVRDQVVPAAVEIALQTRWIEADFELVLPLPVGSGTIVSSDGLILTNHHVIDLSDVDALIAELNQELATDMQGVTVELASTDFLILGSEGNLPPVARYTARVVSNDPLLDLAVLRVTGDASGSAEAVAGLVFPHVPLGDSDAVGLGDRVHVFSYPAIGGDVLTYTDGAVSGFQRQEGIVGVAWITTDAVLSGGSSGGTAINDAGELIGVPTQGSELDCRPGDTNRDGIIDMEDIGCIPTGGSLGQLRPSNHALALLQEAMAPAPDPTPTPRPRRLIGAATPTPQTTSDLDLPRLALYPADLAAFGHADYAVDWGQLADPAGAPELLAIDASWASALADSGLREVYLLRNVRSAPDARAATYVTTTLWEYPDAASAMQGFDLVERQIEETLISTDEAADAIAEESELTVWEFTDPISGEPMTSIEVTFRLQRLVASVRLSGPSTTEAKLRGDLVELAAAYARTLDRVLANSDGAAPPLSARIVRVIDNGAAGGGDYYLMQDGAAAPLYWFASPDTAQEWTEYWQAFGVVDAYETEIFLPVDPSATGPRTRVGARLYAFASESEASAFVAAFDEDLRSSGALSVRDVSDAPAYGDESRTVSFETDWWTDVDPEFRTATTIRVGEIVASLEVGAAAPPPSEVLDLIAAAQEECLERGCATLTMPAPAWLLEQPGGAPAAATETPRPSPTALPTATPSPAPTPELEEFLWGIDEPFDDPGVAPEGTDVSTVSVSGGEMTLTILEAGGLDGFVFDGMPTEGRDVALAVDVVSTSGWGEITLRLGTENGDTEWFFAIDPVTNQWSLYRTSIYTNELFYWVEPRSFAAMAPGPIQRLELQVESGRAILLINGIDVVAPTGIAMPEMDGSLVTGFGAGINPYSLTGYGESFTVVIDRVTLIELPV